MVPTSFMLFFQMSTINVGALCRLIRFHIRRIAFTLASLTSVVWLTIIAAQPVHIPVYDFPEIYEPLYTQVLSGVKGQTFTAPGDDLSRIDIWARTQIKAGDNAHVRFDLKRDIDSRTDILTGIVIFDRSGHNWQVRLVFDPDHISKYDMVYLRLESVLSSADSSLHYAYFGGDLYAHGELLERDRLETLDQDLRFKLYRDPIFPKPIAWLEAAIGPAVLAAERAKGPPAWVIVTLMVALGSLGFLLMLQVSILAARVLTVRHRPEATITLLLVLIAVAVAVMAGAEAPIGKLWVPLSQAT